MRALALSLLLLPAAARAEGIAWLCDLQVTQPRAPLPAQLVIGHDPGTGAVVVNDPVIAQFVGLPLRGRVEAEDRAEIVFLWSLAGPDRPDHPPVPRVDYRAVIAKAGGAIVLEARVPGRSAPFTAAGRCLREDLALRRVP